MTDLQTAAQQALGALELARDMSYGEFCNISAVIDALRAALAAPSAESVVFGHYCRHKAGKHPDGWVCQPFYTQSTEWLLAQCEEYQRRAHEAEREVVRLRAAPSGEEKK